MQVSGILITSVQADIGTEGALDLQENIHLDDICAFSQHLTDKRARTLPLSSQKRWLLMSLPRCVVQRISPAQVHRQALKPGRVLQITFQHTLQHIHVVFMQTMGASLHTGEA